MYEIRVLPNGLISRKDAASIIGVKPETLASWNSRGTHDQYFRKKMVGSRVFYEHKSVLAFADGRDPPPVPN